MGLAALAGFGSQAEAALVFDIRLADGTKSAQATAVGQVFNFEVWATLDGLTAAPEGLQSAIGYIRTPGALKGNLAHTGYSAPFNAGAAPAAADRDGDGDLDLGGATTVNGAAGEVFWRAATMQDGNSFKLSTGTFTVTQLGANTPIQLFISTPTALNRNPVFKIDGVGFDQASGGTQIQIGAPITIAGDTVTPTPLDVALEAAPDSPTFNLVVTGQNNSYATPNPLNAGDELPAGGINAGGISINTIGPEGPVFILLGLNNPDALDGSTMPAGSSLVPENDPEYVKLKSIYPFLDALIRFADGDDDRNFNFNFSTLPGGVMVTEIAAVPEPTVLGLASLAGLGLLARRRRNA